MPEEKHIIWVTEIIDGQIVSHPEEVDSPILKGLLDGTIRIEREVTDPE